MKDNSNVMRYVRIGTQLFIYLNVPTRSGESRMKLQEWSYSNMTRDFGKNKFPRIEVYYGTVCICGISSRFQLLSPCIRQVTHALLTRPPLSINKLRPKSLQRLYSVRLACVKHAASVHPEPGSNSHVKSFISQPNKLG